LFFTFSGLPSHQSGRGSERSFGQRLFHFGFARSHLGRQRDSRGWRQRREAFDLDSRRKEGQQVEAERVAGGYFVFVLKDI
jgi:hypothetical protein